MLRKIAVGLFVTVGGVGLGAELPGTMPATMPARTQPSTVGLRPPAARGPLVAAANLQLNMAAPAIDVTDLDGKGVKVTDWVGMPVVLQFGSLTEPLFRAHSAAVDQLAQKLAGKAKFVLVYTVEAHAADGADALDLNEQDGFDIAAPETQEERVTMAQSAVTRLGIKNQTVVVDAWNNATYRRYGARPNMTFVLDDKGKLQAAYPWMDVKRVEGALEDISLGRPVALAHQGPVKTGVMPAVAGGRGGQAGGLPEVALILDGMQLSPRQKQAIMIPLADYFSGLRNLREALPGLAGRGPRAGAAGAAAAGTGTARGNNNGTDAPKEDPQVVLAKTREAAMKLKVALNENLTATDLDKILRALEQGPGGRFFDGTP